MQTRAQLLSTLHTGSDVVRHGNTIVAAVEAKEYAAVEAVMDQLLAQRETRPTERHHWDNAVQKILTAFALTTGLEPARRALALALRAPTTDAFLANCMHALAYRQPAKVIETLLAETDDLEAAGFLLHNTVVMEKLVAISPIALAVQTRLREANHPFSWLPLTLLPIEATIERPSFDHNGWSCACNIGRFKDEAKASAAVVDYPVPVEAVTDTARSRRITRAFHTWEFEGADKTAGEIFFLEGGIPADLSTLLPVLGMRFLRAADQVGFQPVQPQGVFERLFSGSIIGPAYGTKLDMAQARLRAWQSLVGLVGADPQASAEDVARLAEECRWCLFFTSNAWFLGDLSDLGIACANDKRREMAVLAVTDTD